ncbi:MAG: UPF0149 family protein [Wenzhouxiangella sp.]|jgi:uncharacterized protein YgfB (UPF0149 family)|nr:UPF0149 family protein [Wenzhouxiangella sp.]
MSDQDAKLAWILALAAETEPTAVAETHGLVVGLLSARPGLSESDLMTQLAALQVGDWSSDSLQARVGPALASLRDELDTDELRFRPLLPTDDRPLAERTSCLAHWCSGFLSGFGAGEPVIAPGDATEALGLLEQIARAATDPEADAEAEESAYTELVEFVRVAVLLLREDQRGRKA